MLHSKHDTHIAERMRAKEGLKFGEELQTFINVIPDSATVLDSRGNFLAVNDRLEELTGYKKDELLGNSFLSLRKAISPKTKAIAKKKLAERLKGTHVAPYTIEAFAKNGEKKIFEINSSKIEYKGKPAALVIMRDITEHEKMEDKLRSYSERLENLVEERTKKLKTSEEKFRRIYNASLNGVYTVSFEGEILDMNSAGVSMLGYESFDELRKVNIKSLYVNPDDRKRLIELAKGGPVKGFETKFKRKDGKTLDILINSYPFMDEKGRIIGFQGAIIDITERKEMEKVKDQLLSCIISEAAQRKEVEEMKDRFISAVTHELRTPLVSIKGYLDLVLTGELGQMSSEVESNLQVVKRNTDRLLSLTNDLLDIRRIESGKLQLNIETLKFRETIDHCIKEIQPFIDEKKQSLHLEVPEGLLPVQGDHVRLSQVIMNLLSNATKYTPENGEITLSVSDEQDVIKVQISDTGIGIRKEDLGRVFEPFATIQKPMYIKGTGLGLSVTKGLVEAHGGKIWAESPGEGKGATFTFIIPKQKKETEVE